MLIFFASILPQLIKKYFCGRLTLAYPRMGAHDESCFFTPSRR
jgi:hypothetical protein